MESWAEALVSCRDYSLFFLDEIKKYSITQGGSSSLLSSLLHIFVISCHVTIHPPLNVHTFKNCSPRSLSLFL